MNKHAMANEYKILCSEANKMSRKENRGETTSNGWKVVDNQYDRWSNFKGVLYEKTGSMRFVLSVRTGLVQKTGAQILKWL